MSWVSNVLMSQCPLPSANYIPFVLMWVLSEQDLEKRIQVQVIYLVQRTLVGNGEGRQGRMYYLGQLDLNLVEFWETV